MRRGLARQQFQQQHAEAVDVGLLRDPVGVRHLRGPVAGNAVGGRGGAGELGEPEVGDAGLVGSGEEDVRRLDVAVGDGGSLRVEV